MARGEAVEAFENLCEECSGLTECTEEWTNPGVHEISDSSDCEEGRCP